MPFPSLLSQKYIIKAERLKIRVSDISESFVKGGGHGGQKINKTANAVFLMHRPTGFHVKCQAYRERERNRAEAYKILIDKIEHAILGKASERSKKIYKLKRQKQRRSRRAQEKVLEAKKHRSDIKHTRKPVQL